MYEEIGSFLGVSKYLETEFRIKIHDTTIKRGLERKFKHEGKDFDNWVQENDKSIDRSGFEEKYTENDVKYWILIYQKIGSYKGVVKFLKKKFGKAPLDATIKRKIKEYFDLIGEDFVEWEKKYSKFPLGITQGYPLEEIERWEMLYEKIGSFKGVSDYLREVEGSGPADITIKRRLERKFIRERRDFESWIKYYEDWHFKIFSENDVKNWILLYKRIGSFYGVEKFLKDKYGQAPSSYTIFSRIKQAFERKNRNFNKWRAIYGQRFFEEICRSFFELMFKVKFLKVAPEWLRNPISGRKLHLDGYNIKLRLAFEYNGPQHYEFTRPYHKTYQDLNSQRNRDDFKIKQCDSKNVDLIIIPYTVKIDKMQEEIKKQYESKTKKKLPAMPKYDYKRFFYHENLDQFL